VANFATLKVLKGNFSRSSSGIWIRNTMIVLQFCIATFFIISGIIINSQVNFAMNKDLGFHADQIISIGWDQNVLDKFADYQRIKQELTKIPGVMDVNTSVFTVGKGSSSSSSYSYKERHIQGQNMATDFGFLPFYGIKISQGRDLDPNLASDSVSNILINKTAMEMMGENDPVGKEILWNGKQLKIVGVVDDFHLYGIHHKIPPMTFFHIKTIDWMKGNISSISVKIKPENMEHTIRQIEHYWTKKVDTKRPFNYDFVDKIFARTYADYVNQRNLFAILNIVVISIALFGLFALSAYTIERRYQEIAVKKVLGITSESLVFDLTKQYILLLVVGFILALPPSYYLMQRWLDTFAYRIELPLLAFFTAFGLMFVLTLAVVVSKALKATRINALTYIKYE